MSLTLKYDIGDFVETLYDYAFPTIIECKHCHVEKEIKYKHIKCRFTFQIKSIWVTKHRDISYVNESGMYFKEEECYPTGTLAPHIPTYMSLYRQDPYHAAEFKKK